MTRPCGRSSLWLRARSGELRHSLRVHFRHAALKLEGKLAPGEMDVLERCLGTAMACEGGDQVQLPAGAGQVGEAQVPLRMCAELREAGSPGDTLHDLRPGPQRDRSRAIPTRRREKQRARGRVEAPRLRQ